MENVSAVLVPLLTLVERPSSLLRSVLFRAVARFARTSCVVLIPVVSSFYPCVVTSLCDAHDAHSVNGSRKLLSSCHHNSFHYTKIRNEKNQKK